MLTIKPKITITPQIQDIIKQNENLISSWFASTKFRANYLQNPSYAEFAPFLDPDSIDFRQTDPKIAWELNLPLPNIFKFIIFGSHGCGNTGVSAFLRLCGGREILFDRAQSGNAVSSYIQVYNEIIDFSSTNNEKFCFLNIRNFINNENGKKFYSLVPNAPLLCFVRDPISALSTFINNRFKNFELQDIPSLDFAKFMGFCGDELKKEIYKILENYIRFAQGYFEYDKSPSIAGAAFWSHFFRYMCYHDGILGMNLVNLNPPKIIDMSEIISSNAFGTFTKLAKEFNFNPPSDDLKTFFSQKISEFNIVLPIKILAFGTQITIDTIFAAQDQMQNKQDLGVEISELLGLKEPNKQKFIAFVKNKNEAEILKNLAKNKNKKDSKKSPTNADLAALQKFIAEVLTQLEKIAHNLPKIQNEQILELFLKQKDFCAGFYKITNQHLLFIRAYAPQILQKWEYFNEFLKICKKFKIC